jgi:hypothetical protein
VNKVASLPIAESRSSLGWKQPQLHPSPRRFLDVNQVIEFT